MSGYTRSHGNTISEYGIILGLTLLLCLSTLALFGGKISMLLGGSSNNLSSSKLDNYFSLIDTKNGSGGSGSAGGAGSATMSATGIGANGQDSTSIQGGTSSGTNATSTDGNMMASADTALSGAPSEMTLADMAKAAKDPAIKKWLGKMAKDTYYMAGAQGTYEGVPELTVYKIDSEGNPLYNKSSALRDLSNYTNNLASLMNHPPPGMDPADLQKAISLATTAYNSASKDLAPYKTPSGALDKTLVSSKFGEFMDSYKNLVPYDKVQDLASLAQRDGSARGKRVGRTIEKATQLDNEQAKIPDPGSSGLAGG